MSERYGPWHELTVRWSRIETKYAFAILSEDPIPVELDIESEVHFDYVIEHPAECGKPCFCCQMHPSCGIDYDISSIGWRDTFDGWTPQPGHFWIRHVFERYSSWGGTEYSTWVEFGNGPD